MFGGYIQKEEDIIDREKLNKYLDKPEYAQLKKSYSNLLIPDLTYVENIIDGIINRKFHNRTKDELDIIKEYHKLYYNTGQYLQALKRVKEDKVIILTGNPGVGKSTTARMIILHLLLEKWDNFFALYHISDIEEVMVYNKKQLFFIDDFWGSQFNNRISNRDELKNFARIIERIQKSPNHYLILTSRTYIIDTILNKAEIDIKKILELKSYTLLLEEYTLEDKAKIFLNHLLYYNCEREYLEHLRYNDLLKNILSHPNYSPRHIEYFIKYVYNKETDNYYTFYQKFQHYLEKPYDYWEEIFRLQSNTAQLILLLIFISSDPIEINDLRKTFKRVAKLAQPELNLTINLLEFDEQIKVLEELFITTSQLPYTNEIWLKFRSPGIKDYLLEYLRNNIEFWGEVLIKGAEFFNQLHYVFSTYEERIPDVSINASIFGKKIVLSAAMQNILKNKILLEFDQLNFSTNDFNEVADMLTRNHNNIETEFLKLLILMDLFDIKDDYNINVRNFILERVHKRIQNFDMCKNTMLRFPNVIKLIKPFLKLNPWEILTTYHRNITFAVEYDYFYKFKNIFPEEFEQYYHKHIKMIREHLRMLILENINYYQDEDMEEELDNLLYTIDDFKKKYRIRLNKEFILKIEERLNRPRYWGKKKGKKRKYKSYTRKIKQGIFTPSFSDKMLSTYLEDRVSETEPEKLIKTYCSNKQIKNRLLQEVKKENSFICNFTENLPSVIEMIDFICCTDIKLEQISRFAFIDHFVKYCSLKYNIDQKIIQEVLPNMSFDYYYNNFYFRENIFYTDVQIKEHLKRHGIDLSDPDRLYPLIIHEKNWYTFLNSGLIVYFVVQALKQEKDENEYKETVIDICAHGDILFQTFIQEADAERFREKIVKPEMERFLNAMNPKSPRDLVLSFLHFFDPSIDLTWKKRQKSFENEGGSSQECFIQELLYMLGIISDSHEWEVDTFFCGNTYKDSYIENNETYKKNIRLCIINFCKLLDY